MFQPICKRVAPPGQQALDRLDRRPHGFGDFLIAQVLEILQHEGRTLTRRKCLESMLNHGGTISGRQLIRGGGTGRGGNRRGIRVRRLFLFEPVQAKTGDDTAQVGSERGSGTVARSGVEDLQEGILRGILGLGRVLKQSPCRIPGRALVAAYDPELSLC